MLALLDEERETCSTCGHQVSDCRDEKTAGTWQVMTEICQPGRVMQATAENGAEAKTRGLHIYSRRAGGHG